MKLFISHSSKNSDYGNALLSLLTDIGVPHGNIVYTSSSAYGIPVGENIFDWLKERFDEKPLVLFLISNEYYSSVACLNEMGASWVVGSKHIAIFTPRFDLEKHDFRSGALDPRKMGFYIDDEDRVIEFIGIVIGQFGLTTSPVIVNKATKSFLKKINQYKTVVVQNKPTTNLETFSKSVPVKNAKLIGNYNFGNAIQKFIEDIKSGKLLEDDILLLSYILDTGREKLGVGWKTSVEVENIKAWESIHDLNYTLSRGYENSIRRFEFRKLATTSDLTSHGNPREVTITEEMSNFLLNIPDDIQDIMSKVVDNNKNIELPF